MKTLLKFCVATAALAALTATAQSVVPAETDEDATEATERRQALMTLHSWTMAPLGGMLQGEIDFDADVVQHQAERMAQLAGMIPDVFVVDTREFDLETEALDGAWSDRDGFVDAAAELEEAALAAAETAEGGDPGDTLQAVGGIGQSCGGCHDNYRE